MTVNSATSTASYAGNGTTQVFAVPFYFLVDTDLKVSKKTAATGVITTLALNSDYTLAGAGNNGGGTLTAAVAPATGDQLFIERNIAFVQQTAYPVNNKFPSDSHEKALDRDTMGLQQLGSQITRSLQRDAFGGPYNANGIKLTGLASGTAQTDAAAITDVYQIAQMILAAAGNPGFSSGAMSVKTFGAVGNNVADDTTAFQNAFTFAANAGARVFIPAGTYKLTTPLVINMAAVTSESAPRVAIEGEGKNVTVINYTGTGSAITFQGGTSGGLNAYFRLSGLSLRGNGIANVNGVTIDNMAFSHVHDVLVTGFTGGYGVIASDILSTLFDGVEIRGNKYGFFAQRVDQSDPNAITFVSVDIGLNSEFGIYIKRPTTFTVVGGSVQGNGLGGVSTPRFGVKLDNGGSEGAAACSFTGTYFEFNVGQADVYIDHSLGDATFNFRDCTFNRINSTNFVTNNIYVATAAGRVRLNTAGCGFKGFGSYVSNAARPYIFVTETGTPNFNWSDSGSLFVDPVEAPAIAGPIRAGVAAAAAWARINGSTGASLARFNGTPTKTGTGQYLFTYDKAQANANNVYAFATPIGSRIDVVGEVAGAVDFVVKDFTGVAYNPAWVSVTVFGVTSVA